MVMDSGFPGALCTRSLRLCYPLPCIDSALTPDDVHTLVTFTAAGTTAMQNRLPSPAAVGERFL